jgi:hypothetical protein
LKLKAEQLQAFAVPFDSFVSTYTRRKIKKPEMAEKMTLTAYLAQRGVKAKALTRGEAQLLGIPFPLQGGWPRKYGATLIEEELLPQLLAYAGAARQSAEEKARAKKAMSRAAAQAGPSYRSSARPRESQRRQFPASYCVKPDATNRRKQLRWVV